MVKWAGEENGFRNLTLSIRWFQFCVYSCLAFRLSLAELQAERSPGNACGLKGKLDSPESLDHKQVFP